MLMRVACRRPGKHPIAALAPQGFLNATIDPNAIADRWSRIPDANIGIATGKESNLVILDVDGPEGEALLEEIQRQNGPTPRTAEVTTGKGRHLWFSYPKNISRVRSVAPKGLKLDTRADGGYVVAPPSVHASGRRYAFAPTDLNALAECPAWMISYANGELKLPATRSVPSPLDQSKRSDPTTAAFNLSSPPPYGEAEEARLRSALACIPATERDTWLTTGMGIHWLGWGDQGFQIWDDWSKKAPEKYDGRDQKRTWASFDRPYDGRRITVATIFSLAKEYGWSNTTIEQPSAAMKVDRDPIDLSPGVYDWKEKAITAADLHKMTFPPIRYVVPGFIPEGLTLLVGRPKIGKSWLALDLCLACAGGWSTLGSIKPACGDVLYLALEDGKRRLQSWIDKLISLSEREWPSRLHLVTSGAWRRADLGGLDDIENWCRSVANPVLVIVDTHERIRKPATGKGPLYSADYESIMGLQKVAAEQRIAIVVLHHDRKSEADDAFDTVSGTLGLTGAADTILIFKRKSGNVVLHARTRYRRNRDGTRVRQTDLSLENPWLSSRGATINRT